MLQGIETLVHADFWESRTPDPMTEIRLKSKLRAVRRAPAPIIGRGLNEGKNSHPK